MKALLILTSLLGAVFSLEKQYMDKMCSRFLVLEETGKKSVAWLFFSESFDTDVEFNCSLTVSGSVGSQVVVSIQKFLSRPFCQQYLEIISNDSKSHYCTSFLDESGIGIESNALVFQDDTVLLNMMLGEDPQAPSFDILLTSAKPAPCDEGTYPCNNGLCIWNELACNKMNNCGDNSDEIGGVNDKTCMQIYTPDISRTYLYIVIFVFVVLLGTVICLSACYCLSKTVEINRRRSQQYRENLKKFQREQEELVEKISKIKDES